MKKLPDCRNSAPSARGKRRWACSIASPPRLAPIAAGRADHAEAAAAPGRCRARARGCRRPRRSTTGRGRPAASSATRNGGSSPLAIFAAAKRVSWESVSYSGPSLASSSRSGWPAAALAGLQIRIGTCAPSPRPRICDLGVLARARPRRPATPAARSRAARAPTSRRTRRARASGCPGRRRARCRRRRARPRACTRAAGCPAASSSSPQPSPLRVNERCSCESGRSLASRTAVNLPSGSARRSATGMARER